VAEGSRVQVRTAEASSGRYIVVLRAPSSARFLPEEGWEHHLESVPGLGLGAIRVRTFTRWVPTGGGQVPRELVVEVTGSCGSLDEAVAKFQAIAWPIAAMIGFVTNVSVGMLEVHLAYECTAGSTDRPFLEAFLPDERGAVTEGRIIRRHLLEAACPVFLGLETDSARVSRGLRQYELALRQWYLGGEWLALSHLYMAVETLTEAVLRKALTDRGITDDGLARSLGVVTDDPAQRRWPQILRERVREQMIFGGDRGAYQTAKSASDGLEHGFLELDEIARHAQRCAGTTFQHVRRTIIDLLGLSSDVARELMAIKPKDVQSRRKVIRGRLVGAAQDPAAEGELYPRLEWSSEIASVTRNGSAFQFRDNDKVTVRIHPDVTFMFESLLIFSRLEDGQITVQADDASAITEITPEPRSASMLAAVMPLVKAATASMTATRQTFPGMLAFKLFGEGVAFFESAQLLINDKRPVEALPSLRSLVIIAARFEQMTDEDGPGIGILVRMALEMPEELGATAEVGAAHREQVLSGAAAAGIAVPAEVSAPDASAIHTSLTHEMRLASGVVNNTLTATWPHLRHEDADHAVFSTQVEPGPFTEMIASACVIAQLELLRSGAKLFGWDIDQQEVTILLDEARELNEASADSGNATGKSDPPNP
jgi:hypothetical protein